MTGLRRLTVIVCTGHRQTCLHTFRSLISLFVHRFRVLANKRLGLGRASVVITNSGAHADAKNRRTFGTHKALVQHMTATRLRISFTTEGQLWDANIGGKDHRTHRFTNLVRARRQRRTNVFRFAQINAMCPNSITPSNCTEGAHRHASLYHKVIKAIAPRRRHFANIITTSGSNRRRAFTQVLRRRLLRRQMEGPFVGLQLYNTFDTWGLTNVGPNH